MSEQINLVVSAQSDGVKDLSKELDNIVKSVEDATASAGSFSKATEALAGSTSKASDQAAAYLQKITTQADVMGKSSEYTMSYIAALKGADEAQKSTAASIGAQIDSYKSLSAAQAQAIQMDDALTAAQQRMAATATADIWMQEDKAIRQLIADKEQVAKQQQALIASQEKLKSVNLAEQWRTENKEIKANLVMLKQQADAEAQVVKQQEKMKTLNLTGQRQQELAAIKAQEAAEKSLVKSEQDYIKSLAERAQKIQHNTEVSAEAIAKERGYSAETIAKAKELGIAIDKATKEGAHSFKEFDASILRSGGVTREYMVLLHELYQGNISRLSGSMMVLAERTNLTQLMFTRTALAAVGLVAVIGLVGFEAIKGVMDLEKFNKSLQLTGNYSALTASYVKELSHSFENSHQSSSTAKDAILAIANTGRFTKEQLQALLPVVLKVSELSGKTATEVVSDFSRMGDGVYKFAIEQNKSMHFANDAQLQYIEKLEKTDGASTALLEALKLMNAGLDGSGQHVQTITGKFQEWLNVLNRAPEYIKNIFNQVKTLDELKQNTVDKIKAYADAKLAASKGFYVDPDLIAKAKSQMEQANKDYQQELNERERLGKESRAKELTQLASAARDRQDKLINSHKNEEKNRKILRDEALAQEVKDNENRIREANGDSTKLLEIAKRDIMAKRAIEEEYKPKKPESTKHADNDMHQEELEKIQAAMQKAKFEYEDTLAELNSKFKTQEISKFALIAQTSAAEATLHKANISGYTAEIALAEKQKENKAEIQKFNNSLLEEQRKQDAESKKMMEQQAIDSHNVQKEITKYEIESLNERGKYIEAAKLKAKLDSEDELKSLTKDAEYLKKLWKEAGESNNKTGIADVQKQLELIEKRVNEINKHGLTLIDEAQKKEISELEKILSKLASGKSGAKTPAQVADEKEKIKIDKDKDIQTINKLDPAVISAEKRAQLIGEINKKFRKDDQALDDAQTQAKIANANTIADSVVSITQDMFGKKSEAAKAAFAISKAMAIAEATMNIANAISRAPADMPWYMSLPVVATIAAQGATIMNTIQSVKGYETGGYTGDAGTSDVAGVVHGQEFVVNAEGTRNNRAMLEAMNKGQSISPMVVPAFVSGNGGGSGTSGAPNIHIENHGTDIQVQPLSEGEIRVIARQAAQQTVKKETPNIVSSQLAYSNSSISKALSRNTQTQRRRD